MLRIKRVNGNITIMLPYGIAVGEPRLIDASQF